MLYNAQSDLQARTGVVGRFLRRADDPWTWMEIYENVADVPAFDTALEEAIERHGLLRFVDKDTTAPHRALRSMCLILVAWQAHPDYPLVVAANRDEFFAAGGGGRLVAGPAGCSPAATSKPAAPGAGLGRAGRFAGLTNFRDPQRNRAGMPSRGAWWRIFSAAMKPAPG